MTFGTHQVEFLGKRVYDFELDGTLQDPATSIPALRTDWEREQVTGVDLLRALLQDPKADQLTGLIIGSWVPEMVEEAPTEIVEALVSAAEQLPSIQGLFIGDVTYEECEVSWLQMTDLSPLLDAYEKLQHFQVRGSQSLKIGKIDSPYLKTLILESGGMPRTILSDLWQSNLPALEHLEIYLGDSNYGWDGEVSDLSPLLSGELFPQLKYLGLRDSEISDQIAQAVAQSNLIRQLEVLDLSLGTLGDTGAAALLASPAAAQLKKLDIHHHYVSADSVAKLRALGIEVDDREREDEGDYGRYVAIGE